MGIVSLLINTKYIAFTSKKLEINLCIFFFFYLPLLEAHYVYESRAVLSGSHTSLPIT